MIPIYVVIPVYNAEYYLENTVTSVVNQQYPGIRIVLVDDGSSDNSPALCDILAQKYEYIQVIHQKNGGVSSARNAGIEYVLQAAPLNAYLTFLDADDFWHPHFLNRDILNEIAGEPHDIYAFGMITCDEEALHYSTPEPYCRKTTVGGLSAIWSLKDTFGANLYHISLFKKWDIRFFEGYKYSEDKYFKVLCSFFANSISFFSQVMYIYRESSCGAMSRSANINALDYYLPIVDGWMRTENFINGYTSITGVATDLGHILGNVYLLDMICAHYMQQGSCSEIRNTIFSHPNFQYLLNMKPMGLRDINYSKKELYFSHPVLFAVKYRLIGLCKSFLRLVLQIPIIQRWNKQRKYPLDCLPR